MKRLRPLTYRHDDSGMHYALMQAAQNYLEGKGDHRFANGGMLVKVALLLALCGMCYWMSLQQQNSWAFFACYFGFIFIGMFLTVNVVHDASHNAFFRSPWSNRCLNALVSVPLGLDPDCWRVRHVLFHHAHNNIEDYDPDIESNGVLRQTPFQHWRPFMHYQRYYWPLVAALTFPYYIWLFDWLDRAGQTRVTARMAQQGVVGWCIFLTGKTAHLLLALIIPCWLLPPTISIGQILFAYLMSQMLSSLLFVMLIIGTHWAKASFYQAPAQGMMPHSWYQHVFATTLDWQTRPYWLGYWLGGANLHLTHHLFPNWSHRHYQALSRIIGEVAPRFGIDYRLLELKELLHLQQHFLSAMGSKPE